MPRKRFADLPELKRRLIVEAAADELANHGYDKASVNRVIAVAGISKGALYYWFEDKEDLFVHAAKAALAPLGAAIGKPGPVGSPQGFWSGVQAMLDRAWEHLRENPRQLQVLRAIVRAHAAGDLDTRWTALTADTRAVATQVVLMGQALGAVREDLPIDLLIAVVMGIGEAADLWFEDRVDELDEEEVHAAIEALHDVLRRVASAAR